MRRSFVAAFACASCLLAVACATLKVADGPDGPKEEAEDDPVALDDDGDPPVEGADGGSQAPPDAGHDADAALPMIPVRAVAQGIEHACALDANGKLSCFGVGSRGQLGNGSKSDSPAFVAPLVSGPVRGVAADDRSTCAILTNGAVQCWGSNQQGRLGIGSTGGDHPTPQNVDLPFGAKDIALGTGHALVALQDGSLYGWGLNFSYELGDGTQSARRAPGVITGFGGGKVVAVGAGFQTSCAVLDSGELWCWGLTGYLPFEPAVAGDHVTTPRLVADLPDKSVAVSLGVGFGCTLLENGTVYCWGDNGSGQLGDGSNEDRIKPVKVRGLDDAAIALKASGESACVILATGVVRCWGNNSAGQLGDPTLTSRSTPISVAAAKDATAITISVGFACAGFRDGDVRCWGSPPLGVTSP